MRITFGKSLAATPVDEWCEAIIRFPVRCPYCKLESLDTFPLSDIAAALLEDQAIRLHATCHPRFWDASDVERHQIREYLAAVVEDQRTASPKITAIANLYRPVPS